MPGTMYSYVTYAHYLRKHVDKPQKELRRILKNWWQKTWVEKLGAYWSFTEGSPRLECKVIRDILDARTNPSGKAAKKIARKLAPPKTWTRGLIPKEEGMISWENSSRVIKAILLSVITFGLPFLISVTLLYAEIISPLGIQLVKIIMFVLASLWIMTGFTVSDSFIRTGTVFCIMSGMITAALLFGYDPSIYQAGPNLDDWWAVGFFLITGPVVILAGLDEKTKRRA